MKKNFMISAITAAVLALSPVFANNNADHPLLKDITVFFESYKVITNMSYTLSVDRRIEYKNGRLITHSYTARKTLTGLNSSKPSMSITTGEKSFKDSLRNKEQNKSPRKNEQNKSLSRRPDIVGWKYQLPPGISRIGGHAHRFQCKFKGTRVEFYSKDLILASVTIKKGRITRINIYDARGELNIVHEYKKYKEVAGLWWPMTIKRTAFSKYNTIKEVTRYSEMVIDKGQ